MYKYSEYGIGFDGKGEFRFGNEYVKNSIVFGVDLANSSHDNNKKNILVFGKYLVQGIKRSNNLRRRIV